MKSHCRHPSPMMPSPQPLDDGEASRLLPSEPSLGVTFISLILVLTPMTRLAAVVALLCLSTGRLAAAEIEDHVPPDKIYAVPEIVVSAPRPGTTVGGASAIEVHVDSLAIPPAATFEEVFRAIPLLHVRTNSRGEAEISARGSESRQVAVLVDGIPITLSWDGRADVSVIPSTTLQDVVFIRGLSSMLCGPNVLGGVIDVRIGQADFHPEPRATQVALGVDNVGAFGTTVTTSLRHAGTSGEWHVRGGVGYRNSPGDPLARGIAEPLPREDDLRLNTDAETLDGFVVVRYRADQGTWLAFSGSSFLGERGIAAELGVPDAEARCWRYPHISRTLVVVSGGTGLLESPFGGQGNVAASVGFDRGRTDIDAYTARDYRTLDAFENGKDRTLTFRLLVSQMLGRGGDLRAAFIVADIHHDESVPDGEFEYEQRLWSAGLEGTWQLVESLGALKSLALSAGGACDVGQTPKAGGREALDRLTEGGGRIGLSAVVGGRSILHAGVSRRGRFPSLRELYSGALNRFAPNPALKPEKLLTAEAGVTTGLGRGQAQIVLFHSRLDDAVARITLEDRRFMRVNRDELRSTGIELAGSYALGPVALAADLTLQDVELTDTQASQTNRPENLPEVFGSLNAHFPLLAGVEGGIGVEHTGEQFSIDHETGGDSRLPAQAIVNASISRAWPMTMSWVAGLFSSLETRCAVENVGDAPLYDAAGLPEPGRRIRFEVRMR